MLPSQPALQSRQIRATNSLGESSVTASALPHKPADHHLAAKGHELPPLVIRAPSARTFVDRVTRESVAHLCGTFLCALMRELSRNRASESCAGRLAHPSVSCACPLPHCSGPLSSDQAG